MTEISATGPTRPNIEPVLDTPKFKGQLGNFDALSAVRSLLRQFPVVAVLGARQVGKSTWARQLAAASKHSTHFDLENTMNLARLSEPMLSLGELRGLIVIDKEIQRQPELFPTLRVLADRGLAKTRFLVLGSASPALLRQSSESLAGRIAYFELGGFGVEEVGASNINKLWLRGGFPRSFLARNDEQSLRWRQQFIDTYLERDLPSLGFQVPAAKLGRFWRMLANGHGQIWNGSDLGRSLGVSDAVVKRYLDILRSTFVVRILPAVLRKHWQASGGVPQGLPFGYWIAARAAPHTQSRYLGGLSKTWRVLRGFCHWRNHPAPWRTP